MPEKILRFAGLVCFVLSGSGAFAQQKIEMADTMRSNGKIYVVVAVSLTILIGLFLYLVFLDKKISRFENKRE